MECMLRQLCTARLQYPLANTPRMISTTSMLHILYNCCCQKGHVRMCVQLPSRRQILAKLEAEKQALADLKKDPIALDPDAESLARLKALKGEAQRPEKAPVPVRTAQVPTASLTCLCSDRTCGSCAVHAWCCLAKDVSKIAPTAGTAWPMLQSPWFAVSCSLPMRVCWSVFRGHEIKLRLRIAKQKCFTSATFTHCSQNCMRLQPSCSPKLLCMSGCEGRLHSKRGP